MLDNEAYKHTHTHTHTHTQKKQSLLLSHDNNGYQNTPQCFVNTYIAILLNIYTVLPGIVFIKDAAVEKKEILQGLPYSIHCRPNKIYKPNEGT